MVGKYKPNTFTSSTKSNHTTLSDTYSHLCISPKDPSNVLQGFFFFFLTLFLNKRSHLACGCLRHLFVPTYWLFEKYNLIIISNVSNSRLPYNLTCYSQFFVSRKVCLEKRFPQMLANWFWQYVINSKMCFCGLIRSYSGCCSGGDFCLPDLRMKADVSLATQSCTLGMRKCSLIVFHEIGFTINQLFARFNDNDSC